MQHCATKISKYQVCKLKLCATAISVTAHILLWPKNKAPVARYTYNDSSVRRPRLCLSTSATALPPQQTPTHSSAAGGQPYVRQSCWLLLWSLGISSRDGVIVRLWCLYGDCLSCVLLVLFPMHSSDVKPAQQVQRGRGGSAVQLSHGMLCKAMCDFNIQVPTHTKTLTSKICTCLATLKKKLLNEFKLR